MINNNETIALASVFGFTAGVTTQSLTAIIIDALAVGVIQPLFRIIFTNLLTKQKDKDIVYKEKIIYRYRTKPKTKKKQTRKRKK